MNPMIILRATRTMTIIMVARPTRALRWGIRMATRFKANRLSSMGSHECLWCTTGYQPRTRLKNYRTSTRSILVWKLVILYLACREQARRPPRAGGSRRIPVRREGSGLWSWALSLGNLTGSTTRGMDPRAVDQSWPSLVRVAATRNSSEYSYGNRSI